MSVVPTVDNRISMGNILVAGGMIVSVALAWGNLAGRAETLGSQQAQSRASIAANEARIRALENAAARQDERMILILDSLRKIEGRIEDDRP